MISNLIHKLVLLLPTLFFFAGVNAQTNYRYSVDLTNVSNDQLTVELITPPIAKKDIVFYFPKIVPGTYMNSNYGKYVHDLKAFTRTGSALPAKQSGDNSWNIKNADKLYRITYHVEDTWDSDIKNKVYTMCGTNFEGLITPDKFLETLAEKIIYSRSYYKDDLSFTELSTECAGKHADQFGNVYTKGALISACLDLYLLQLSGNQYGLRDLKHDLGVKYGKDKYFEDDKLFDEIEKLTYPEIKEFLLKHVQGGEPIPCEKYFALAGVQYIPEEKVRGFSMGGIGITADSLGRIVINDTIAMNDFGKKMGYQDKDELVSLNGDTVIH
jgi:predicted metalloprotease with PDZ domain